MSKFKFMQKAEDKPKVLDLYIYDPIEEGCKIDWSTWTIKQSETSAQYFREQLNRYKDLEQINLYMNTVGGDVFEGMAIRNQLKRCGAKVVATVDGIAASAGAFILTGCNVVRMYSNSMQMVHEMWCPACGNARELRKVADDMDKMMEGNRKAFLEKANGKISEKQLIQLLENETWLTADECLKYGLCDEVLDDTVDMNKAQEMLKGFNNSIQHQISFSQALRHVYKQSLFKPVEIAKKEPINEPIGDEDEKEPQQENNFTILQKMFKKESDK